MVEGAEKECRRRIGMLLERGDGGDLGEEVILFVEGFCGDAEVCKDEEGSPKC